MPCPSRRPRRSGWTASSSTGTTPRSTCSPTRCTTAAACSRASAPTRPTDGPAVFRLTDHIERLFDSAKILMIDIPYTVEELVEATQGRPCGSNDLPSCYIRPIVYLGYGEMGLNPLPCAVNVSIACWPWGAYLGDEGMRSGVRMKISSWQRHDPNAMPPAAKGTGIYINSSMAKVEALKAGYDEAILLTPQGYVAECTGENIFVVKRRRDHHAAALGRRARGHHAGLGDRRSPATSAIEVRGRQHPAQRPLHRRRGVPLRHRGRGRADPLGRRPRDRRPGPDHPHASRRRTSPPSAARSTATRTGSNMSTMTPDAATASTRDARLARASRDLRHDAARRLAARGHLAHRRRQAAHRRAARLPRRRTTSRAAGRAPTRRTTSSSGGRRDRARRSTTSTLVAFGSTRRVEGQGRRRRHAAQPGRGGTSTVCIVGKCWDYHVLEALQTTLDEGVAMVADSVAFLRGEGLRRALRRRALLRRLQAQPRVHAARARGAPP